MASVKFFNCSFSSTTICLGLTAVARLVVGHYSILQQILLCLVLRMTSVSARVADDLHETILGLCLLCVQRITHDLSHGYISVIFEA